MFQQLAAVDYIPGNAQAVAMNLAATLAKKGKGPGLTQDHAVQLAADLAVLRNACTLMFRFRVAYYRTTDGALVGTENVLSYERGFEILKTSVMRGEYLVMPIVGVEPLVTPGAPGKGLPDNWGAVLALAIDRTCNQIAKAEQGGSVPQGEAFYLPTIAPAALAIIVGGAAAAIIGTAAVWRYLDPDLRIRTVTVREASKAYAERLATYRVTGTMPEPSPVETANAKAIETAAKEQSKPDWGWAIGVGGGIAAGSVAVAWIRSMF